MPVEFVMGHIQSMTRVTAIAFVLSACLAGCASWTPDPIEPCDESQRQQLEIASLPGCAPLIHKTYNYDY